MNNALVLNCFHNATTSSKVALFGSGDQLFSQWTKTLSLCLSGLDLAVFE
jgi:hypothetical protein